MKTIIDLSHHQLPSKINYDLLAKQVDWAIIRTQFGSKLIDRHYGTHHEELQRRGIPTAAYAWVRGVSVNDMKVEAKDFYERTKKYQPSFWFLDVEEASMSNMRQGVSAYVAELRRLGAKRVGIYVGHHLYKAFQLNLAEADAVWLPHYGKNNGKVTSKPSFPCDIHQYTDKGSLPGYHGPLDLNRLLSERSWNYFVGKQGGQTAIEKEKTVEEGAMFEVTQAIGAFRTADDAKRQIRRVASVKKGKYYVYNRHDGMVNVTKIQGQAGSWINPAQMKKELYYTVKRGDTLSAIAQRNGTTVARIKQLNPKIKNIHLIYANDKIRIR